jgi:hypothetical protein
MKNLTILLPFDNEKLEALRMALEAKDVFLEDEVERFLNGLYKRTVAKQVQIYLDGKSANAPKPPAPRPAKAKAGGGT